jgi:ABC-2 type transport system ATP-binding protein
MAAVLRTEGLSRHFGAIRAVDDVSLEVGEGDVYGFLGHNGSGKTTTLRLILQLIRPTAGRVEVFGLDPRKRFIEIMRKTGALVELPAYYPYLSAEKNLEILRVVTGGVPKSRIPEVLEIVGLRERMRDRVGTYSQGMRQRLGIAMALLPSPRLVFLDEPTNGLDPQGIHHIRSVIRRLNREEGVTFVISSHLLHEVELTCNRVGMMKQGRLFLQDRVDRILEKTVIGLRIACEPAEQAAGLLRAEAWAKEVAVDETGRLRVRCGPERFAEANALLQSKGVRVSELTPERQTLEEFFLSR